MAFVRPSAAASDRPTPRLTSRGVFIRPRPLQPTRRPNSGDTALSVNAKNWQELKKPSGLEKKAGSDGKRKATFVAEPLERGFGLTLGNALRRVLLSSLQGAAVTSIKIENVLHEFSSLAGVREDVTDIVLNVKQIALRMQGEGPKRLQLSATGPTTVTAGDIAVSGDIEVMTQAGAVPSRRGRDAEYGTDRGCR